MPGEPTGSDQIELDELLDSPETPEEKAALDALAKDPERVLAEARARAEKQKNDAGSP